VKNIIITGSTKGAGLNMAREFLKAGCNVTVSGKDEKNLETAKKVLSGFSGSVLYVKCNVGIKEEVENLWNESAGRWGQIDYWINNAGQNCPHKFKRADIWIAGCCQKHAIARQRADMEHGRPGVE